jgi:hypothetical protein
MDRDVQGSRDASSDARSIASIAALNAVSLTTLLLGAYVAALILFPADLGLRVFGFVLSPARIVLLMLLVASVATGTLSVGLLRSENRALLVAWAAFLAAALIATMLHPTAAAFSRLASFGAEGLVVYLVTRAAASDPMGSRTAVRVAVYATLVVIVLSLIAGIAGLRYDSILTTLTGGEAPPNLSGVRFGFIRQQASFPAALFLAIWIAACTALVLPWSHSVKRSTVALVSATWGLLAFGMAILTVSRIAMTGVFVIAGIYLLRWGRRVLGTAALAVGFAVALGFAGLSSGTAPPPTLEPTGSSGISTPTGAPTGPQDYPSEADILAGSNELRVRAIQTTLKAVAQEPLFGWGLLRAKDVVTNLGGSTNYVDSSYLVFAVDMGLVGLATFIALVAAVLVVGRAAWSTREGMALALACLTIVGMSVVAAYLNVTQGYATFWLLAALMVNAAVAPKRPSTAT